MSMTSQWSALYFVALMTFGNYVLFNLLVAILVEGFSMDGDVSVRYAYTSTPVSDLPVAEITERENNEFRNRPMQKRV